MGSKGMESKNAPNRKSQKLVQFGSEDLGFQSLVSRCTENCQFVKGNVKKCSFLRIAVLGEIFRSSECSTFFYVKLY